MAYVFFFLLYDFEIYRSCNTHTHTHVYITSSTQEINDFTVFIFHINIKCENDVICSNCLLLTIYKYIY